MAKASLGLTLGDLGRQEFARLASTLSAGAAEHSLVARRNLVLGMLREQAARQELAPEDLGSLYEGTLGLELATAREPVAVLSTRRKAGGAHHDVALELKSLFSLRGSERARELGRRGVTVDARLERRLTAARTLEALERALVARGAVLVRGGASFVSKGAGRRLSGSHYTSPELAARVARATLLPLVGPEPDERRILALRVLDPAMGSAAFLLAVCRVLAELLLTARRQPRTKPAFAASCREIAERCVYGVDKDPIAVEVARMSFELLLDRSFGSTRGLARALVEGDALVDDDAGEGAGDFGRRFPEVFARGGFDAVVGNPPWVSYAGRAAQPLEPRLRAIFLERYAAFAGYRNLQGLFVERAATLLRPGGRLGLLLPSSMSELAGYAPTRLAHDRLCAVDQSLPDLGEHAFSGVFQPSMVLLSTRRKTPSRATPAAWPLERPDLDAGARALMAKLARKPLPGRLFAERGLQSQGDDQSHLSERADGRHTVPLRSGADVRAFCVRGVSFHADPSWFGARLRPETAWREVRLLVRQTARVPIAALSDGAGFRNSLLAGFEDDEHPAEFLVAYLNSSPIRWLHYVRHRDARLGMPQVKVAHLRATPAPPNRALVDALAAFGSRLSARNDGLVDGEQAELDELVSDAFGLDSRERERLRGFTSDVLHRVSRTSRAPRSAAPGGAARDRVD